MKNFMNDFNTYELKEKLNSLNRLTYDAIHNSEDEFLIIGSKLHSFLAESKAVTDLSYESAKMLSDGILTTGIQELEVLLQQFSGYLQNFTLEIRNDKEELLRILSHIRTIYDELNDFNKIVKQLKMLGISTKIESSRLGGDDQGFTALAESVENLSSIIGDKTIGIKDQSTFLIKEIVEITTNLTRVERVQNEQSNLILGNTSNTLAVFEKKNNQCSKIMNMVLSGSQRVSKNIAEIVSSIQFHDITRQQIEHVNEVITSMDESCNSIDTQNEAELIAVLSAIRDTSELQSAQMRNANDEFYEAVSSIISSLKSVEESVSEIFLLSSDLILDNAGSAGQSFKCMEDELTVILEGLIKNITIGTELSNSIKTAVSIIDELANNIKDIEEIGTEIELIALNARIRSARTGNDGSALGVIAEAIQKLSLVAKKQTIKASDILLQINNGTDRLRVSASEEKVRASFDELALFDKQIKDLLTNLQAIEKQESGFLNDIKARVRDLEIRIGETLSNITIQEKIRDIAYQAASLFKSIIDQVELLPNIVANRKNNTSSIKNIYTMHSERKIHENFTGGKTPAANNFNIGKSEDKDGFGDNVELF
jgi:methyl-accepting chemotaxis protein